MDNKEFITYIAALINKKDLSRQQACACFKEIIVDNPSRMQQGAFIAAITAKGQTSAEIAGIWQAIYELDTVKVQVNSRYPLMENCGSGMDAVKTFNISSAAAIVAAADGIAMAKHGARAITSACGTIDILEELGINVECAPEAVKNSIEKAGIGVFNGMSSYVHPRALGRILSETSFGTVLNIAASLANPALPLLAVRGVYSKTMLLPVAQTMRHIGYKRALVVYGEDEHGRGLDEASTMGLTYICELQEDGRVLHYTFAPEDFGLKRTKAGDLAMGASKSAEASRMLRLLNAQEDQARTDIVCLNAALAIYLAGHQPNVQQAFKRAYDIISSGLAAKKLNDWIRIQQ
ncbi:MAG: anthranilate phosphoribosyltransferase [Chloroflexi bacterium]|nr:anthranilate phosphoribosyltransferase [Chloroflexota bacterium]